ncbi:Mth938-like domain-containing protein [Methylocystis sp.]|uniref:Mth938-like domain-containing protein n=1 Tax=Methylocystis sp. TaxID=1911079 RepID=UPI0027363E87|nr:Mth938-like domain-containing protein [Methylocystis sp.]MDP3554706.1 Mth938-like domain-containing protein [Methylocystis sp.]
MTSSDGGYVPGRHKIDDYGGGGFRFADMSHRGSILALPSGVRAVPLTSAAEIDDSMIDCALSESGGLDVFVVGTGKDLLPLAGGLRAKLRAAGVGCETMATGAAVRTYNVLVDENRRVGALLIAV